MKSPSILEADVWSNGAGARGEPASGTVLRAERLTRRPHRRALRTVAPLYLTNSLLAAAGVMVLLSVGHLIADALGDPLLGIVGASLLVPLAAPLMVFFIGSARRYGREEA